MKEPHPLSEVFWENVLYYSQCGKQGDSEEVLFHAVATIVIPCYAYDRDEQQWYSEGRHGWERVEEERELMEECADFITRELCHSLRCGTTPLYEQMLLLVNRREVLERIFTRLKAYKYTSHSELCRYWREGVCTCNGEAWELSGTWGETGLRYWIHAPTDTSPFPVPERVP